MSPRARTKAKPVRAPKATKAKAKPVNTRSGTDRRSGVDRRQVDIPVANDRRSGADRRSGVDRRAYRGLDARLRMRLVLLLGALLAYPAVRTWSDGAVAVDAMAIRVAVAFGFAGLAVSGINALLVMYAPKPNPSSDDQAGILDAETIDELPPADEDAV